MRELASCAQLAERQLREDLFGQGVRLGLNLGRLLGEGVLEALDFRFRLSPFFLASLRGWPGSFFAFASSPCFR